MTNLRIALVTCLAACQPSPQNPPPRTGTPAGSTPGATTTGTATGTDTHDSSPPLPVFDCATISPTPISAAAVPGARGYHDVAFTDDGYILGVTAGFANPDLIRADGTGTSEIVVDAFGQAQGMTWLPDGDLAVASDSTGAVVRVNPTTGAVGVISPSVYAYGLILGPDGKLWAANQSVVLRIDIATGAKETIIASIPSGNPRVLNFNRDLTRLYIGTLGGNGNLFYVEIDANFDPVPPVQVFANNVGTGDYHDALGVDICGYLYVPDYSTSALYRISPSGQVQTYANTSLTEYGHGLEWGNGVGPWRTDAIYLPQPYNQNHVVEVVTGIPTVWEGEVINAPLP